MLVYCCERKINASRNPGYILDDIYQNREKHIGSRNSVWFRIEAKMASRFAAVSKEEGLEIIKTAVPTNTMRATNFKNTLTFRFLLVRR